MKALTPNKPDGAEGQLCQSIRRFLVDLEKNADPDELRGAHRSLSGEQQKRLWQGTQTLLADLRDGLLTSTEPADAPERLYPNSDSAIHQTLPAVEKDPEQCQQQKEGSRKDSKPKKRGPKPRYDRKLDKRIRDVKDATGMLNKDLAREFFGDETKTREVEKALDRHRKRLKRLGRK